MLNNPMGNIHCQPTFMSWSYLNLGKVQRTHMKVKEKMKVLAIKAAA